MVCCEGGYTCPYLSYFFFEIIVRTFDLTFIRLLVASSDLIASINVEIKALKSLRLWFIEKIFCSFYCDIFPIKKPILVFVSINYFINKAATLRNNLSIFLRPEIRVFCV